MDNLVTIPASITYPLADIEAFADRRGYQSVIANPGYVAPVIDQDTLEVITPAVGEPTIPNPQNRVDFVKVWFKAEAVKLFAQDIDKAAEREAKAIAEQAAAQKKAAIEAAINVG